MTALRGMPRATSGRIASLLAASACAIAALYLADAGGQAGLLREADEAGAAGRYAQAESLAGRVSGAPADARALALIARARLAQGDFAGALPAYARAARRSHNDWQLQLERARALLAGGDRAAALVRLRRALALNPRLAVPPEFHAR